MLLWGHRAELRLTVFLLHSLHLVDCTALTYLSFISSHTSLAVFHLAWNSGVFPRCSNVLSMEFFLFFQIGVHERGWYVYRGASGQVVASFCLSVWKICLPLSLLLGPLSVLCAYSFFSLCSLTDCGSSLENLPFFQLVERKGRLWNHNHFTFTLLSFHLITEKNCIHPVCDYHKNSNKTKICISLRNRKFLHHLNIKR